MDVFLSIKNRQYVIKLPVLPETFQVSSPQKNEVFETVTQGELKLIGLLGLKTITWSSFFPSKDYPFLRDRTYKGLQYAEKLEGWRKLRIPMRLVVSGTNINVPMVIDNLDYQVGPSGDIDYTITLSEFKLIQLKKV